MRQSVWCAFAYVPAPDLCECLSIHTKLISPFLAAGKHWVFQQTLFVQPLFRENCLKLYTLVSLIRVTAHAQTGRSRSEGKLVQCINEKAPPNVIMFGYPLNACGVSHALFTVQSSMCIHGYFSRRVRAMLASALLN